MADSVHSQILAVYQNLPPLTPCVAANPPATPGEFWHVTTWGPAITIVAVAISAGAPAPGSSLFLCPGDSSAVYVRGTPEAVGVYNFTIDATLSNASHLFITCEQTVTLAGPPAGPGGGGCSLITISPASPLPDTIELLPLSIQFEAEDGTAPYTWDLAEGSELPDGLALSSGGLLTGAATTAGSYAFTVRAIDDDGCRGIKAYALEVLAPDAIIVFPVPPLVDGVRGEIYAAPDGVLFTATGGIGAPYDFTISDGDLPPGLALAITGELEGRITAAGLYTFTVRATDGAANFGEREYSIEVSGLRILIGEPLVDVTIEIEEADLELTLNRQATGRFVIGDDYIPTRGAPVLVYARDGVTPIFGGIVHVRRLAGMTASNPANRTEIDLADYSIFFDDADPITIVATAPQYLEDVIAEIVAQSLAVYGITYDAAPTGKTVPPIEWVDVAVVDAFKRITDATGVVFRVGPLKALVVFVPLDSPAPVTITDANVNAFDLDWTDPPNLAKNTVDLLCGPTGTGVTTQQWEADGYATSWEVDIQAVIGDAYAGARAHAFLGVAVNFADGDTTTLGSSVYTWRAALVGDVAGEVLIGADGNASLANLVAAIVGAGGGVYAPSTAVNTDADAYIRFPDQLAANALAIGVAGNSIALATTGNGQWYGEGGIAISTMQLGADPSGAAGWTQGYILENGTLARTIGPPGDLAVDYEWNVLAGRGTITLVGTAPAPGTILELKYLAVFPFHARVSIGSPPLTFREAHPEIVVYADGIDLATQILARESNDRRELEVFTDVDGFLPGQELGIDTTYRGGIVDDFLVAAVRIHLVNAELWEYRITAQESDEYAGSYVEQWKALTSGGGSGSSSAPATLDGGAAVAGDIYSDGRASFRSDQSMGGHKLRFVDDPALPQDAATKAYTDAGDAATLAAADVAADAADAVLAAAIAAEHYIKRDGSIAFTGDQSMGAHKITDVTDPTNAQDAATKAYVDAGGGGGSAADHGFFGVGGGAAVLAAGPILIKPTGTTLTFVVGIGAIGTGDALVVANVQLTDLTLDDSRAVMNRSLVSFGGQHLFGLVHITGLTAGKEYAASLMFAARVNGAAFAGGPGPGQPFLVCLDLVTSAAAATVETAEASSSGTFADLATAGPSATISIGSDGVAAVIAGDSENRVQTGTSSLGVVVSGANTLAAGTFAAQSTSGAQNIALQGGLMLSRLASGSTTFKLQYASDGGSNTRYARWIAVLLGVFGGTPIVKGVSAVATAETRASTAYGALTTADSVTLTTGTLVLVLFSVNTSGSGVIDTSVAVDVSGATTIAAADGVSNAKAITAGSVYHVGRGVVMTVNAGSNVFALRYKTSSGTGTFSNRVLAVLRLN
jgi:hypothetical protein